MWEMKGDLPQIYRRTVKVSKNHNVFLSEIICTFSLLLPLSPPCPVSPGADQDSHRESRFHRQSGDRDGCSCLRVFHRGQV